MTEYKGNRLTQEEKDQIWEILCECDGEFYPKLSARESSSQKQLIVDGGAPRRLKPVTYYNEMIAQEFLVARDGERITGFMTFKKDYICDALKEFGTSLYITTVCVRHGYRGQGIMKELYGCMETEVWPHYGLNRISTRTWSLNEAQLHELDARGYQRLAVLENDRGNGVDTIYFGRVC